MSAVSQSGSVKPAPDAHAVELEARFLAEQRAARRRRGLLRLGLNIAGVVLVLAIWEAIPHVVPGMNAALLPPPSAVLEAAIPLVKSGEIPANIAISLRRAGSGFILAARASLPSGRMSWHSCLATRACICGAPSTA